MHKLLLFALVAIGQWSFAQSLACRFEADPGRWATVTITAEEPWLPGFQSILRGTMTIEIAGLELTPTLPVNTDPLNPDSRFDKDGDKLTGVDVLFNVSLNRVRIYRKGEGLRIFLEAPHGLFGGAEIDRPCL